MQDFADRLVAQGAYANLSEVVREGMCRPREERGAAAFHALKADLEQQARQSEAGRAKPFDAGAFEPRAFK